MAEAGANALLVVAESSRDPDLAFFVGSAHLGQSFVLAASGCAPRLCALVDMERTEAAGTGLQLIPAAETVLALRAQGAGETDIWTSVLADAFTSAGLKNAVVAVAGHFPSGPIYEILGALERRGFSFVDGSSIVREVRKRKSRQEVEEIRRVAAGACAAFRRVAEQLASSDVRGGVLRRSGGELTAGALRREIALVLASHGLWQPEGNIVATGSEAGVPHAQGGDDRVLRSGEAILVDLYPKGQLFADCTRTFCVGEVPEQVGKAHRLCASALAAAGDGARPGMEGAQLQQMVCDLFEAEGFETSRSHPGTRTGYVHGLGHGVGHELHEYPSFRSARGTAGTLEVNDVFTLEPGLYSPEEGYGVRLEDLLLLTDQSAENLTPLPYDLDPCLW